MNSHKILVLGGGFAGLWSAVGAAQMLDKLGLGSEEVAITLVNADPYHCIRVRNYEADLSPVRVPLDDVLGPVRVQRQSTQSAEHRRSRETWL
jgi:NADH:ubiquinone reductase (H+-translocating)